MKITGTAQSVPTEKDSAEAGEKNKTSWSETLLMAPAGILALAVTSCPLSLPVLYLIALFVVE